MSVSLMEQVRKTGTLDRAWRVICQNGRRSQSAETRREIERFAEDAHAHLAKIQRQLNRTAFKFQPAKGIPIAKKGNRGIRPLVVAPIASRIVQRAILDVLLTIPEIRRYAENPYSFGGIRKPKEDSIAAVPAAIQAVLNAIRCGATYAVRSDISSFFTRIPKPKVTAIVESATGEPDFVNLFKLAITVELENLSNLQEHAADFPIYEIGVAQGNSLSPLLGNILLHDFDQAMNSGGCQCIRYVDDFLIMAPDRHAAEEAFLSAVELLRAQGMEISREKTMKRGISDGFEFLGIELANGLIRPSRESRARLLRKIEPLLASSASALLSCERTNEIIPSLSLIRTLYHVSGVVHGWGHHYAFCNDKRTLQDMDGKIDNMLSRYLGIYSRSTKKANHTARRRMIGIPPLQELSSRPFQWPHRKPTAPHTTQPRPDAPEAR